jgi:hypothetical protein
MTVLASVGAFCFLNQVRFGRLYTQTHLRELWTAVTASSRSWRLGLRLEAMQREEDKVAKLL